ncbi:hypothetical protein C8R45DRAFT_939926 [Mycena sanguinolenta]|nr:hypothetical protein C8R45DRAFT_939926 [Mycena sanguinolenta]
MDEHYKHDLAAAAVEEWNVRLSSEDAPLSGVAVPASRADPTQVAIIKDIPGGGARLVFNAGTAGETEAVFSLVGALHVSDLPPVSLQQAKMIGPKCLWQHVTIVGYNSAQFKSAVANMETIAFEMSRSFKNDELCLWRPGSGEGEVGLSVSANCRYFTVGPNVPADHKAVFDPLTDPRKHLESMLSSAVHYTFDNVVTYLALAKGEYAFYPPESFKVGDIVEVGFTITVWKLAADNNGAKFTTNLVLRTLTLLDGALTRKAALDRSAAAARANRQQQAAPVIRNQIDFRIAKRRQQQSQTADAEPEIRNKFSRLAIKNEDTH